MGKHPFLFPTITCMTPGHFLRAAQKFRCWMTCLGSKIPVNVSRPVNVNNIFFVRAQLKNIKQWIWHCPHWISRKDTMDHLNMLVLIPSEVHDLDNDLSNRRVAWWLLNHPGSLSSRVQVLTVGHNQVSWRRKQDNVLFGFNMFPGFFQRNKIEISFRSQTTWQAIVPTYPAAHRASSAFCS